MSAKICGWPEYTMLNAVGFAAAHAPCRVAFSEAITLLDEPDAQNPVGVVVPFSLFAPHTGRCVSRVAVVPAGTRAWASVRSVVQVAICWSGGTLVFPLHAEDDEPMGKSHVAPELSSITYCSPPVEIRMGSVASLVHALARRGSSR